MTPLYAITFVTSVASRWPPLVETCCLTMN